MLLRYATPHLASRPEWHTTGNLAVAVRHQCRCLPIGTVLTCSAHASALQQCGLFGNLCWGVGDSERMPRSLMTLNGDGGQEGS